MNEKKNLDRLFQEKFKDFEVAPPEFVWENIQEILQEKKKRRVIPIWFKLSGVAALLVLSGLLATLFFNNNENPAVNAPAVVIDNTTATPADAVKASPVATPVQSGPSAAGTNNASQNQNQSNNNTDINTAVASGDENTATKNKNAAIGESTIRTNSAKANTALPVINRNNAVAHEDTNTITNKKNRKRIKNTIVTSTQQNNAVAVSESSVNNSQNNNNAASLPASIGTPKTNTATNSTTNDVLAAAKLRTNAKNYAKNTNAQSNFADKNNTATQMGEGIATAEFTATDKSAATTQQQNTINGIASNGVNNSNNGSGKNQANAANANNVNAAEGNNGNTIIDRTLPFNQAVTEATIDTTKVVPENELEKRLQEILKGTKEEDKPAVAETKPKDRWNIKPQVAPVFYNSLTNGSPINEQFASNSKSYDNQLSVGLGVNYALNDKISIRSGVNSVNLSYATNGIAFYASLNGITNNIGDSRSSSNIVVQNPGDVPNDPLLINGTVNELSTGSMVQKTGYIEVPLEMSYAVVNNKFGIDVIGGISTLFLNQNNVSVVTSTGLSTQVGEAQNLNNVHFSTNVGLGFKYRFWDSFQANFEPMFKYQVNAYTRDAGNFKPYFIGLYTGVSFSF